MKVKTPISFFVYVGRVAMDVVSKKLEGGSLQECLSGAGNGIILVMENHGLRNPGREN